MTNSINKKIPKVIHLTYFSKKNVKQKVWDNLEKYAKDYKIIFYDDDDCIKFLKDNYGNKWENKFKNIKIGAHKADFFRYCLLYKVGGIYMDIKLEPKVYLNTIFDHTKDNLLYTVLGSRETFFKSMQKLFNKTTNNGHIFQALIATYPKNPLMKELYEDFFRIEDKDIYYNIYTQEFYYKLQKLIDIKKIQPGLYTYKNNIDKVYLFEEQKLKINGDKPDRYGGYFKIMDKDKILFNSRYHDFPWK